MRWQVLAMVMSGVFLSTMDSGMINVALPTIMRAYDISLESAGFVVSLYLLTITVTLVFWGKLGDRLGRGKVYLSGMTIFSCGALACYCSPGFYFLLLSRFFQALGASMMMASGPAIIKMVFPPSYLGRSLGLVGVATACGLLAGPFASGLVLAHYPWQAIFLVTLPVCVTVLIVGWVFLLRRIPRQDAVAASFDWLGSCCWVGMAVFFVLILHRVELLRNPLTLFLLLFLAMVLAMFVRTEKKAANPILPLVLLRQRYFWVGTVTAVISFCSLFAVLVLVPFFLEYILHMPVENVGRVLMAVPATLIFLSPASGRLYDRIGARFLTTAGMGISTCALASLAWLSPESTATEVMGRLALLGAGQSIFLSPNSASILSRVDEEHAGVTAGILATARNFGMVTGATLAAALFAGWFAYFSGGSLLSEYSAADERAFVLAWRATLLLTAGLSLFGGIISIRRQ